MMSRLHESDETLGTGTRGRWWSEQPYQGETRRKGPGRHHCGNTERRCICVEEHLNMGRHILLYVGDTLVHTGKRSCVC